MDYSMEENSMSVFKSYLRLLLQELKNLKAALDNKDYDKVNEVLNRLMEDTQKGIEDN